MRLSFSSRAWSEYLEWQGDDRRGPLRVNTLLEKCRGDSVRGTGIISS
ncbi:type II toxin-antitoxin system YoeB family toxin [Sphingomonas abaci]|uniref:Txe/YoeB family toxin of Txe-Axe toxin-antitoxin module n=1 Tax=Sphingomonas abaci TaxID=237611 RepID=A0A7W7AII5_9SPHN|nr:type II toxin-antitoxin system YoeB family toxin [Sphingomonas abaci]MBB4616859.1 Txe/YoeB family toxin of Txe-Axe toxin-antitoxin module [Sphingomonas abaci]